MPVRVLFFNYFQSKNKFGKVENLRLYLFIKKYAIVLNIVHIMARPFGTKNIETPEKLLQIFEDYVKETKSNPITVKDWVGKDAQEVSREKERPLTVEGLELYCFKMGFIGDLGDYFSNKDERYSDYATICSHIKKRVRQDQIAGGMAGIYNPSITQRLNGLVEKTDQTIKVNKVGLDAINDEYV